VSQWRCKKCGAIRSRPTLARVNENPANYSIRFLGSRPCKRCGSEDEPDAMYDPWLDFEDEFTTSSPSKSKAPNPSTKGEGG
jgi:hypothetical protein